MEKKLLFIIILCLGFIIFSLIANAEIKNSDSPDAVEFGRQAGVNGFWDDAPPPPPPPDVHLRVPKVLRPFKRERAVAPTVKAGEHLYSDSKTLFLIYSTYRKYDSDTVPTDYVTADETEILRHEIEAAREFVWRHSHAKFNMQITDLVVIDRALSLDQFRQVGNGGYWLPYWTLDGQHSVAHDIADLGLMGQGYDCVVVLYAWKNTANALAAYGGAMYGVGIEALDGAAYIAIPLEWGIEGKNGVIIHEYLHFIGGLFVAASETDFSNPDRPQTYNGDYNFGMEFNAWILQTWPLDKWLHTGIYASIMIAPDADDDGLPDQGTDGADMALAVSEWSFGSSPFSPDTDNDGLNDMKEVIADIFESSSPVAEDTDGDGLIDGEDPYPILPVKTERVLGTPTIDGLLAAGEHDPLSGFTDATGELNAELYFEWDLQYLYISASIHDDYVDGGFNEPWWNDHLNIRIDASNDGFAWHGDDNLEVLIGPIGGDNQPFAYPQVLHADGTIDTTTITESDLMYEVQLTPTGYAVELGIPVCPTIGLVPKHGYTFGYNTSIRDFDTVDWSWPNYDLISGKPFPEVAYVDLTLNAFVGPEQAMIEEYCAEVSQEANAATFALLEATANLQDCYEDYIDCMGGLHNKAPANCIADYSQCIFKGHKEQMRACKRFLKKFKRDTKKVWKQARKQDVEDEFLDWFYSSHSQECLSPALDLVLSCSGATNE